MILSRKNLRKQYDDSCQNMVKLCFRINQLKKSNNVSSLTTSQEYGRCVNELKIESENKINIKREIDSMVINSDMDKLAELEFKFRENLGFITKSLSKFHIIKLRIKKLKRSQNLLLQNIEDSIRLISN